MAYDVCRHGSLRRKCEPCDLAEELELARSALRVVLELVQQLPSGCDETADPDDTSPADAVAHVGGLILRRVREALGEDGG